MATSTAAESAAVAVNNSVPTSPQRVPVNAGELQGRTVEVENRRGAQSPAAEKASAQAVPVEFDTVKVTMTVKVKKFKDGSLEFPWEEVRGADGVSRQVIKASNTNYTGGQVLVKSFGSAPTIMMLTNAASMITEAVNANNNEGLAYASESFSAFASACREADRVITCLQALPNGAIAVADLVGLVKTMKNNKASAADKREAGLKLAASFTMAARSGTKMSVFLHDLEIVKLPEGVPSLLKQIGHGLKVVASVFNFAEAVNTLVNKAASKTQKINAVVKMLLAISAIAFFTFLLLATIFTFGAAMPIVSAVLGGVFGTMIITKFVVATALLHRDTNAVLNNTTSALMSKEAIANASVANEAGEEAV